MRETLAEQVSAAARGLVVANKGMEGRSGLRVVERRPALAQRSAAKVEPGTASHLSGGSGAVTVTVEPGSGAAAEKTVVTLSPVLVTYRVGGEVLVPAYDTREGWTQSESEGDSEG